MGMWLKKDWSDLNIIITNIYNYLSNEKDIDMDVGIDFRVDVKKGTLEFEEGTISVNINQKEEEVIDFLKVQSLKSIVYGLPFDFTMYDTSEETGWNHYEDCYDDGEIFSEEWLEGVGHHEKLQSIDLGIENKKEFVKRLEDENYDTEIYISLHITKDNIEVDNYRLNLGDKDLLYYESKELVELFKKILSLDKNKKELAESIEIKPPVHRESVEDIHNEFLENIKVLLTDEKFNNLIRDYTVLEQDESYLYIDSVNKTATLHRYFKGAYFNANTVYDLPLTLSTQYELEDVGDNISTSKPKWSSETLNGRLQRKINIEQDYYKFARFIEKHFPSLKGENGSLKPFEMSLRLGEVKPIKSSQTPYLSSYGVVGTSMGETSDNIHSKILAMVRHEYGHRNVEQGIEDAEEFYKEYQTFLETINKNNK